MTTACLTILLWILRQRQPHFSRELWHSSEIWKLPWEYFGAKRRRNNLALKWASTWARLHAEWKNIFNSASMISQWTKFIIERWCHAIAISLVNQHSQAYKVAIAKSLPGVFNPAKAKLSVDVQPEGQNIFSPLQQKHRNNLLPI